MGGLESGVQGAEERDAGEVEERGVRVRREAEGKTGHNERVEGVMPCFDCYPQFIREG